MFFDSFMVNHVLQEVGVTIEFMVFIILCFGLLALCLNYDQAWIISKVGSVGHSRRRINEQQNNLERK